MDETQISITIRPIYIERLIYWILILVMAVLLVIAWTKDDTATKTVATDTKTAQEAVAAPAVTPPAATPEVAKATCTDALKNQDETDVDCGGSCSVKCANTRSCKANTDCISNVCSNSTCMGTAPAQLSGKVDLDVTKANVVSNSTTNSVKFLGLTYKVTNGLDEALSTAKLEVFVMNKQGKCFNQIGDTGECDDPFATVGLPKILSGKSFTETHAFTFGKGNEAKGSYVLSDYYYTPGSAFRISVNVVDSDGGNIDGVEVVDVFDVNP
jgi:hypothetical protein